MPAELRLDPSELDGALAFLEQTRYSHSFPIPFELGALRAAWPEVRKVLSAEDLLTHRPRPVLEIMAPKYKYGLRPIQLLDPVDLLFLTALGLRLADSIENSRQRLGSDVVYSFRVARDSLGGITLTSNWDGYRKQIVARLEGSHGVVARADIADFFPRANLHRLENSLDALTGQSEEVQGIRRILGACARGNSYGLPIGPLICNLFAEALLHEVDEYLESHGIAFVRFVDDYVMFGSDETSCLRAIYLLGERLYDTQGLSLTPAKTRVERADNVLRHLLPPEDPNSELRNRIRNEVFGGDPYAEVDPAELTPEQAELISQVTSRRLLETALDRDLVDLSEVKFVLNVLASLRRAEHVEAVLDNLSRLAPASEAVARFIERVDIPDPAWKQQVGRSVAEFVSSGKSTLDFQAGWLLEPFVGSAEWGNHQTLRRIARDHPSRFVRRQAALGLRPAKDRSSLLDLRARVDDAKDWEWRAIVYSCGGLPVDERDAFMRSLRPRSPWTTDELVPRATIEYASRDPSLPQ